MSPFFSICIPTYRNLPFLKRLLDSVASQSFRDFEVIITDNTPNSEVRDFIKEYEIIIPNLVYYKNEPTIGIVENWNKCMELGKGSWIKLMHCDDWFSTNKALEIYFNNIKIHRDVKFFFSAFTNIEEFDQSAEFVSCNRMQLLFLKINPIHLFHKVYVGNPSCTLVHKSVPFKYDNRFKFVVDFEYYIRCFRNNVTYHYISSNLINVGFHREQLTKYTKFSPEIQIPENILLVEMLSEKIFTNPFVFDYYWRLFRNLEIRSNRDIIKYTNQTTPRVVLRMLNFQSKFSLAILKIGAISKILMTLAYCRHLMYSFVFTRQKN